MTFEVAPRKIPTSESIFWTKFFNAELRGLIVERVKYTYFRSFIIELRDSTKLSNIDWDYSIHEFDCNWRFESPDENGIQGDDQGYDRDKYIKIIDRIVGKKITQCHFDDQGRCFFRFSDRSTFVFCPEYELDEEGDPIWSWMVVKKDKWIFSGYSKDEWKFGFYLRKKKNPTVAIEETK